MLLNQSSVVNQEQIETEQAADVADLLENLPNVDISGGPRSVGQRINIRGLGDKRILFLVDGARQNFERAHNGRVFLDPGLLKQAEVVRGPASAVWGSGALGGIVSLTTKDAADLLTPGDTLGFRVKSGYHGANNQWLGNVSAFGLAGENVDYLLDFSYRDADDTELGDDTTLANSDFESYAGLAKLTWTPDLYNSFGLSAQTFDHDAGVPSNPQVLSTPDTLVDRSTEQRNYALRYDYQNPDTPYINPEFVFYYNTLDIDEVRRIDGRSDTTDFETYGVNLRNNMLFGNPEQISQVLSYGVDYYQDQAEGIRDGALRTSFPTADSNVLGIYVQDEITFWDRATLTPGVRWDSFENQANDGSGLETQEESELSFKISLSLNITEWLSLHSAYNESFRAPNLNELFVSGTHFTCGPGCANLFVPAFDLKPEKAKNKEIGFRLHKNDLLTKDDETRFRATYFQNDVEDFIDTVVNFAFFPVPGNPGIGGTTTNNNVTSAELEGFELEFTYDLPYAYAGLTYAQTRGDNLTTNEALSDIPADKWVITTGLRFPKYDLTLGWRTNITDDQARVPSGASTTNGYTLHDINLAWAPSKGSFKNLRVDLGIENLSDRDYRKHLSVLKEAGRNVKATVSYKF